MAKLHVRYMIGGKPSKPLKERLYSFEFPEYPGALLKFLSTLGTHWNISLFNYRNHGADYGRVLCGFELDESDLAQFLHIYVNLAINAKTKQIIRLTSFSCPRTNKATFLESGFLLVLQPILMQFIWCT